MHLVLAFLNHAPPLTHFAFAMVAILAVPPLCARIRLPVVVGLLLVGFVIGPAGFALIPSNDTGRFLANLGKLLLMFFAGLEIDLAEFQRTRKRAFLFGLISFSGPLLLGLGFGLLCGFETVTAVQIGGLFASHTLLAYPIVQRLGLLSDEAVTISIGGTILTDIGALLVLALCVPIHVAGFHLETFALQIVELLIYVPLVLFGLGLGGRYLLQRMGQAEESQFLFMMIVLLAAAIGADLIHIDGMIGAFLAGLAVNEAVKESPAKEKLIFLGNTLFIPVFFLSIGALVDPEKFVETLRDHPGLVLGMVLCPVCGKFAASWLVSRRFHYNRDQQLLIWSLSLPQVAATLAAALAAYQAIDAEGHRLIDAAVLNSVLVLLVATSILGPLLSERVGQRLTKQRLTATERTRARNSILGGGSRVLTPVAETVPTESPGPTGG